MKERTAKTRKSPEESKKRATRISLRRPSRRLAFTATRLLARISSSTGNRFTNND